MKCPKCNNELLNGICIFCKFEKAKINADIKRYKKSFYTACIIYLLFSILNKFDFNYLLNGTIEIIRLISLFIPLYITCQAYKKYPQNKFFKTLLIIFIITILIFIITKLLSWLNFL